jgi:hypothetical protein
MPEPSFAAKNRAFAGDDMALEPLALFDPIKPVEEKEPRPLKIETGLRDNEMGTLRDRIGVEMLFVLTRKLGHVYEGTVDPEVVRERRRKNKTARASRRANRRNR